MPNNKTFSRPDMVHAPLYVVTPVFNATRYRARWKLYQEFAKQIQDAGAILYTVELAFGDREFVVTEAGNPRHIQLRTQHELWFKENMVNLGISRLPPDWQYVAWIDADICFARPDWVRETIQKLQHHHIVQLFSEAQDLSPEFEPFMRHKGFAYCYAHDEEKPASIGDPYGPATNTPRLLTGWHPGFAWAIHREAFDNLGGLFDQAILGSADNHMAKALIGDGLSSLHPATSQGYKNAVSAWQERALHYIRKDIGYVPGLILHYWHGRKKDRRYWDRWKILTETQFDPFIDLKRDWQSIWQLQDHQDDRSLLLRDKIRSYFRSRNEDSIDLDPNEVRM